MPLEIKDNAGVYRDGWPVQTGVPLPKGLIQSTTELRLVDEKGNEIRSQFTVLSRYWALDKSIRWVLLDFQIDVPPNKQTTIYLTNDQPHETLLNIPLHESFSEIEVDTGTLQVAISKTNGNIIQSAKVLGAPIIESKKTDGAKILSGKIEKMEHFSGDSWNTHGWEPKRELINVNIGEKFYSSSAQRTSEVTIELVGPMRTVIAIKGRYMPEENGHDSIKNGIYNYTTRLHFYRGKSYIKVEHDIENSSPEQPQWNHLFREAKLTHSLALNPTFTVTAGGKKDVNTPPISKTINITPGNFVELYQHPPKKNAKKKPSGFFEASVIRDGLIETPIATGKFARFLDVSDQDKGVSIAMRYLWQEAPKAISYTNNKLNIYLHADTRDYIDKHQFKRPEYSLDFGQRSIHDVLYYFHLGNAEEAGAKEIAEAFEYPLFAYAPPAWYSDTETWYFEVSRKPGKASRRTNTDNHWLSGSVGWNYHGKNTSFNSGGHHESLNSDWLSFIRTGKLAEFELNLVESRWTISHLPGLVYRKDELKLGNSRNSYSSLDQELKAWDKLTGFGPKDFYLWRIRRNSDSESGKQHLDGGETYLNRYKALPDMEHYALFRIFEYYYLTGDTRALDSINGFVAWDLNFQHKHMFERRMLPLDETSYFMENPEAMRRGHYSRVYTWMLYTNLTGFHATGNVVYDKFAKWQIRRMLALLRHRHGQLTSWDVNPSSLISFLSEDLEKKIADKFDFGLFRKDEKTLKSHTQSWMEAQGVLALHEAYKTYEDERILDGIWAQADYFTNHVIFYPRLGKLNNTTFMPNQHLGIGKDGFLSPMLHDRHIQSFPLLYHYTGWQSLKSRYDAIKKSMKQRLVYDWFKQTSAWQQFNKAKHSTNAPQRIGDLNVVKATKSGIELTWTSPKDDGPTGKASHYFVKYSDKPIVEFAPTDNPARNSIKNAIIKKYEENIFKKNKGSHKSIRAKLSSLEGVPHENINTPQEHPDWHNIVSFWMAEHVDGEPIPSAAGTKERFLITRLKPHNWFGTEKLPGLNILQRGKKYYIAICSWDEDLNLSPISNVVSFTLK